MKERAKRYLMSIGYDEQTASETVQNATDDELSGLVPDGFDKPKATPKKKARDKPTKLKLSTSDNMVAIPISKQPTMREFDPVAAAMDIVSEAKRDEKNPAIQYIVTPCYKLTICSDVDSVTMKAITAELKSRGGKWSPEMEAFLFDVNPDNVL